MEELLILGLDPGSTVGYAVINLDGEILEVNSLRNQNINSIILNILRLGKIVLIGTDVNPIPKTVYKVATMFGANIIKPEVSLELRYKRKLTKEFIKGTMLKLRNKHEVDALASAVHALKHYKALFNKIDHELYKTNKMYLDKQIKGVVLRNHIPIKNALNSLIKNKI